MGYNFAEFDLCVSFFRNLLYFIEFDWILMFYDIYVILLDFTRFYMILRDFAGFCCILLDLLFFLDDFDLSFGFLLILLIAQDSSGLYGIGSM